MSKLAYLLRSFKKFSLHSGFRCPNCGSDKSFRIERKKIITALNRCEHCKLLFRTPTDDPESNETYYENKYAEGFTTELPTEAALATFKERNFAGTEKDYSKYVRALSSLGVGANAAVFDFGCSWGYGSYQFARAGFDVTSFEIAPTRRRFAQKHLGVRVIEAMDGLMNESKYREAFEVFFSAHVLEHVLAPNRVFEQARYLLRDGGLFISFTPNGSLACRAANRDWSSWWGEKHPNFLDDVFLDFQFNNSPRLFGSSPLAHDVAPSKLNTQLHLDDLSGSELMFVAQKTGAIW